MAQVDLDSSDKDDEKIDVPDPDDDDIHLNDMANFYLFRQWWNAGQQPISLSDLLIMPDGMWDDFKQLLGKYSQLKRVAKSMRNFGSKQEKGIHHER